jgi:hypothetical protein
MLAGKAGWDFVLMVGSTSWPANIKRGGKLMLVENTLAFYNMTTVTA